MVTEQEAIIDLQKTILQLAYEQGEQFRKEHGREPHATEAARMADDILRAATQAVAMSR